MKQREQRKKRSARRILLRCGIALAVLCIVQYAAVMIVFHFMFSRTEEKPYSFFLRYEDVAEQIDRELISFPSGDNMLQGYLYGAEHDKALVVISHGFGSCADGYMTEAKYFTDHGYRVLCYDNTGCVGSEGEDMVGLSQAVLDLDAALTYCEQDERLNGLPVLLYGHSWGGYAVTSVLNFDHDITACVSVAGFNLPMEVIMDWSVDYVGPVAYVGYPFLSLYQWQTFGANSGLNAVDGINATDTPVLLLHGDGDDNVDYGSSATVCHRDQITNPNVQYLIRSEEGRNDHTHLLKTAEAAAYEMAFRDQLDKLKEQYDDVPEDVLAAFYDGVDKAKTSELDEAIMGQIMDFYDSAVRNH